MNDDAIKHDIKRTTSVPGCVAGAIKIQTNFENILLKFNFQLIFMCEFLWCFVSSNIPVLFTLGNYDFQESHVL